MVDPVPLTVDALAAAPLAKRVAPPAGACNISTAVRCMASHVQLIFVLLLVCWHAHAREAAVRMPVLDVWLEVGFAFALGAMLNAVLAIFIGCASTKFALL